VYLYGENNKIKNMKAIIEFELPKDIEEYQMANNASKMYMALWGIKQLLRSKLKYNPGGLDDEQLTQWEIMQDEFYVILDNNDLKLN
jgi:hypothetical protein